MDAPHPGNTNPTAQAPTSDRRNRLAATVIFFLALGLRLLFFHIYGVIPNNDSQAYLQLTKNLIAGNGYSDKFAPPYDPQMMRLPGYPLFLVPHLALSPQHGPAFAIVTQILLGALTCVLVFYVARRFMPLGGAFLAGVLAACDFVHIYLASCILSELLSTFLLTVFFLYAVRSENWGRPLVALGMGSVVAVAVFVRPPALIIALLYALAILLLTVSSVPRAKRFVTLLCFLLPIILLTQLWCLRNYRVGQYYNLSIVKGYYSLVKAQKITRIRPEDFTGDERLAAELGGNDSAVFATAEILHNQYGFSYPRIGALYERIANASMRRAPLRYVERTVFDFLNSFLSPALPARSLSLPPMGWPNAQRGLRENLRERNYGAVALNLGLRAFLAAIFFVLMPLGGYALWVRRHETAREQLLLWSFGLGTIAASAIVAGGSDRFRAPMDPIFVVFIAAGLCQFVGLSLEESRRPEARPGTPPFFDENLERTERFGRINHYYHDEIARLWRFYLTPGDRVLEVGSGTGGLLAALDPQRGVGVDFSGRTVDRARRNHPSLKFVQADARNFALRERFDMVVMSDLIGYLDDVQGTFENLHHCMNPSSRLTINFFNHLWEPALKLAEALQLKAPSGIQNWLSLHDVTNLLRLAGFEPITTGYRFLFPYNLPLVAAFVNRFLAQLPIIRKLCLVQYVVARPVAVCPPDWETRYGVSVVIPTRNELGNVAGIFERTPFMGKATELIFVDGNSTDGTVEELGRRIAAYRGPMTMKLIHQGTGRGKADAVRKGFEAATGDILMILDSDLTMPPEELPKYYRAIATGHAEFVNGCRLVYPMEEQAMRLTNYAGNKFFGMAFSWLLEQPIRDTLCGTKVLSRRDYERVKAGRVFFGDFDPFGDFDLLFGAARIARKIVDLPIRYRNRTYGETKISRWRHGFLLLRMCGIAFIRFKLQ